MYTIHDMNHGAAAWFHFIIIILACIMCGKDAHGERSKRSYTHKPNHKLLTARPLERPQCVRGNTLKSFRYASLMRSQAKPNSKIQHHFDMSKWAQSEKKKWWLDHQCRVPSHIRSESNVPKKKNLLHANRIINIVCVKTWDERTHRCVLVAYYT